MNTFECRVSDLPKKEEPKPPPPRQVTFKEKLEEVPKESDIIQSTKKEGLLDKLTNTNNIKALLIALLVFLLVNSEIIKNILINSFDFLNSNDNFNTIGNILVYVLTMSIYLYFSSEDP